jgi:Uma2 family endonuclease
MFFNCYGEAAAAARIKVAIEDAFMDNFVLDVRNIFELSDEQFYQLCRRHPDIHFERSASGELIIMPPTGGVSGNRNFSLTGQLWRWVDDNPSLGIGFDSSTCFKLPNGADRAPDTAWVRLDRWNALTPEQQEKFPPIAPDFLIELRSRTDDLATLRSKMLEYQANGVSVGVLINPQDKEVEMYRSNGTVEVIDRPIQVDCSEVLPGFVLNLTSIL